MATSTLVPRPGIYGPTAAGPGMFQLENGSAPAVNRAGPNAEDSPERATWGVPHVWQWRDPEAYHKYQPQNAAIFSMPWVSGSQPAIVKILTLQQVNSIARQAWDNFGQWRGPKAGSPPSEAVLDTMHTAYTAHAEDQYYENPDWQNGTSFLADGRASRFLWLSHLSFFHSARYRGPKLINPGEGSMTVNLSCTTTINGYASILNYWGQLIVGQRLYFIIKKAKNRGPYQMVPWAGWEPPMSADLQYEDHLGKIRFGFSYFVGIVNRRPQSIPDEKSRQIVAGLESESPERAFKIASNYPTVDILSVIGDPRS
jgi:hypothetical protein